MTDSNVSWVGLNSSLLAAARYDRQHKWLDLKFRKGPTYRYLGVPADVYAGLLAAPSKGSFFAWQIRDRYLFVDPPPAAS